MAIDGALLSAGERVRVKALVGCGHGGGGVNSVQGGAESDVPRHQVVELLRATLSGAGTANVNKQKQKPSAPLDQGVNLNKMTARKGVNTFFFCFSLFKCGWC